MVHVFNPSTQETETGRSLWVQGQLGLLGEFQDSQGWLQNRNTMSWQSNNNKQKTKTTIETVQCFPLFLNLNTVATC